MISFIRMTAHISEPRRTGPVASVVLSDLQAGSSMIGAGQLSVKTVVEGEETYKIDGQTVRLRPDQLLFVEAGADCEATNGDRAIGMCLRFPYDPAAEADPGLDPLFGRVMTQSASSSQFGRIITSFAELLASNPDAGERLAPAIIAAAERGIVEPINERGEVLGRIHAATAAKRHALFERLERVRGYLHENDQRSVSLAELSSVAALSRFHLARYFRAAFGESPIAYHRRLRLECAASLVATTDAPLSVIAERLGYSDQVSLSHAFRRQFGRSPGGLR
jgi:AraC-like DNA-binding protein